MANRESGATLAHAQRRVEKVPGVKFVNAMEARRVPEGRTSLPKKGLVNPKIVQVCTSSSTTSYLTSGSYGVCFSANCNLMIFTGVCELFRSPTT